MPKKYEEFDCPYCRDFSFLQQNSTQTVTHLANCSKKYIYKHLADLQTDIKAVKNNKQYLR